jgi:hypothetical protein
MSERKVYAVAYASMRSIGTSLLFLCAASFLGAQPTINMLQRVMMIEYKNERGTAFSIDVDCKEYWVTARHILTGAKSKPYGNFPDKTVDVKLLNPGGDGLQWLPEKFTVLQPPTDVDVVVLVGDGAILTDVHPSPPATSQGLTFGGNCEFLGFAYGGGWRAKFDTGGSFWLPFIKRCGVSGMDSDTHMWILDGINNPGFSGGPVILGTGNDLKIVAVISGYQLEPTEVIRGDPKASAGPKDTVNVNTGFIIAYDISHAVDLIKKNPNGPVRAEKK